MAPPPNPRPGFKVEWPPIRPAVLAYCTHRLRDHHFAEDVTERVAIRASKHYDEFLGEVPFLSWVLGIARREVNRAFRQRQGRTALEAQLEPGQLDSIPDESCAPPAEDLPALPSQGQLLEDWNANDWIPPLEVKVVQLRLLATKLTWEQIGAQLGKTPEAAQMCHGRAIRKLRVILFLHLSGSLAGAELIADAFAAARKSTTNSMSAAEIEVFKGVFLRQDQDYDKAGTKEDLLSVCWKVKDCFPHGFAGDFSGAFAL